MKRLIVIILFLFLTSLGFSQILRVKGQVYSEFGDKLSGVKVSVNGYDNYIETNCNGNFKIKASLRDTLSFFMKGYKKETQILHLIRRVGIKNSPILKKRNIKVFLEFNSDLFIESFEKDSTIEKGILESQAIMVINGVPCNASLNPMDSESEFSCSNINPKHVKTIHVFTGKFAIDRFGKYAKNGVIWFTLKCKK